MTETFISSINSEINYNFEFDDQKLNESDNGLKAFVYNVTIFGNKHHIAMGTKKLHVVDNDIAYYPVYLIYKEKVVSKIGVYESNANDLEDEPSFESMDLQIHPKYYKPPFVLDQFIVDDDDEVPIAEPSELKSENTGESIILENGEVDIERDPNIIETYEMVKSITNNGDMFTKPEEMIVFRYALRLVEKVFVRNIDDDEKQKSIKENLLSFRKKTIKTRTTDKGKKLDILFHSLILKYNVDNKLSYRINETVLSILEIMTNTKFILLDKDSKMYSFSVFGDKYTKGEEPEMKQLRTYLVGEETNPQKIEKIEGSISKLIDYFTNFNPDRFVFLQKSDGKFYICNTKMNDGPFIFIKNMDPKFLYNLKKLFDMENHEYTEETQLANLKMQFEVKLNDYINEESKEKNVVDDEEQDKTQQPSAADILDDTPEQEEPAPSSAADILDDTPEQEEPAPSSAADILDDTPEQEEPVPKPKIKVSSEQRKAKLAKLKAMRAKKSKKVNDDED
jgi:hypothetical protein